MTTIINRLTPLKLSHGLKYIFVCLKVLWNIAFTCVVSSVSPIMSNFVMWSTGSFFSSKYVEKASLTSTNVSRISPIKQSSNFFALSFFLRTYPGVSKRLTETKGNVEKSHRVNLWKGPVWSQPIRMEQMVWTVIGWHAKLQLWTALTAGCLINLAACARSFGWIFNGMTWQETLGFQLVWWTVGKLDDRNF